MWVLGQHGQTRSAWRDHGTNKKKVLAGHEIDDCPKFDAIIFETLNI